MEHLEDYPTEILGLADLDLGSPVVNQAKKRGIFVTQDYPKLLELGDLDLILNLSPDKTMQMVIDQLKPEGAMVVQASELSCLTSAVSEWILNRELPHILNEFANFMSGLREAKEALAGILESMLFICNAQAAGLWLKQGKEFVLFVHQGLPEGLVNYPSATIAEGPFRALLEERNVVVVNDVKLHTDFPDGDMLVSSDIRGLILLPMLKDGEVTGTLLITTSRPVRRELENLMNLFEALVKVIAEALEITEKASPSMASCTRDRVTELHNEAYLQDRLEEQISHAWRKNLSFSLLCIRIIPPKETGRSNHPELLNAQLRQSAREVRACIRKMDVATGSKEGDLFLMLPETEIAQGLEIARRILARLNSMDLRYGPHQPLRYGVGLACFPDHATFSKELMEMAKWMAEKAASTGQGPVLAYSKTDQGIFPVGPHEIARSHPSLGELFGLMWELREEQKGFWDHCRGVAHYAGRRGSEPGPG